MYYETFAQAIDAAVLEADAKRALLARPSEVWSMCQEPLYYTQTRFGHFEIELLKDKSTKKFFHVTIYRMDGGTYELVTYIL